MSFISNGSLLDEDMEVITEWTDSDSGTGSSTQVTFDGKSCMKLDSGGTAGATNYAFRQRDLGTFGTRTVFSMSIYCDSIGTLANTDRARFMAYYNNADVLAVSFCTDGLYVFDGVVNNEVGDNLVAVDTWQEWTFDVNWTTKTVDVYLDKDLKASGVDSSALAAQDGVVSFYQYGTTTINQLSYIDWLKVGNNFVIDGQTSLYGCTIREATIYG